MEYTAKYTLTVKKRVNIIVTVRRARANIRPTGTTLRPLIFPHPPPARIYPDPAVLDSHIRTAAVGVRLTLDDRLIEKATAVTHLAS